MQFRKEGVSLRTKRIRNKGDQEGHKVAKFLNSDGLYGVEQAASRKSWGILEIVRNGGMTKIYYFGFPVKMNKKNLVKEK